MTTSIISLFLLCAASSPCIAKSDIIWFNNGDRLTGHIQNITDSYISILIFNEMVVHVPKNETKRWELAPKRQKPSSSNENTHTFWKGDIDLNVNIKNADKKNDTVNLKGGVEISESNKRLELDGKYIYERRDDITKKHNYDILPAFDYFFDRHVFIRNALGFSYDLIGDNYLFLDYGAGFGYQFWNDKKGKLELMFLAGVRQAYYNSEETIFILGTDKLVYPTSTLAWDFNAKIPFHKRLEMFSKGNAVKYLYSGKNLQLDYETNASFGLRYYLNESVRLSLSSDVELLKGKLTASEETSFYDAQEWQHFIRLGVTF